MCYTAGVDAQGNRPSVGVGVVFIRAGRVFLAQRRGSHGAGTWGSAGGHLEQGESLEECARRECWEELGVKVGELRVLCFSNVLAYGRHYVDVEFLGEIGGQEPMPNGADGSFGEYWLVSAARPAGAAVCPDATGYCKPAVWAVVLCFRGRRFRRGRFREGGFRGWRRPISAARPPGTRRLFRWGRGKDFAGTAGVETGFGRELPKGDGGGLAIAFRFGL